MADFLHCNTCGKTPASGAKCYHLSSCGHVFCGFCRDKIGENCVICKAKCKIQELTPNSPVAIKAYFSNPADGLKDSLNQYFRVVNFQRTQQHSFSRLCNQVFKQIQALEKERNSLRQETLMLRKKLEDFEKSNAGYKRDIPVRNVMPTYRNDDQFQMDFMSQNTRSSPFLQIIQNKENAPLIPIQTPDQRMGWNHNHNHDRYSSPVTPTGSISGMSAVSMPRNDRIIREPPGIATRLRDLNWNNTSLDSHADSSSSRYSTSSYNSSIRRH